jgi:hypothetical protein
MEKKSMIPSTVIAAQVPSKEILVPSPSKKHNQNCPLENGHIMPYRYMAPGP